MNAETNVIEFDSEEKREAWFKHNIIERMNYKSCSLPKEFGEHHYSINKALSDAIFFMDGIAKYIILNNASTFAHPIYNKESKFLMDGFEISAKYENNTKKYLFTDKEKDMLSEKYDEIIRKIISTDKEALWL